MPSSSRNVRRTLSVNEGDRQVTQSGHNLWALARAELRPIFLKSDITDIMGGVFNAPMSAGECQQALLAGLFSSQMGDQVDDLPFWFCLSGGR